MKRLLFLFGLVFMFACGNDDTSPAQPVDNFNRQEMLTNWADNIIIPAYTNLLEKTTQLKEGAVAFKDAPDMTTLQELRNSWEQAYLSWQSASMFEIGKAEEISLRNNLNIYPVDVDGLEANINTGSYNLELPSEIDKQGFPALDYLLYGIAADDSEILNFYNNPDASDYLDYLLVLTVRIDSLVQTVFSDWNGGYQNTFVSNSGNNANASTDKVVNDYILYYERFLRAGKVGIPAGVFSGSPLSNLVEAPYRNDLSRDLLLKSLDAMQDFFNGVFYDGGGKGVSLADYLDDLDVENDGQLLSVAINDQFNVARTKILMLDASLAEQVSNNNSAMLEVYDALQMNVIRLKVDMLQALNISVDYVDADGD